MIPCSIIVFSPPSLKFRTAGFPQYGFKREVRRDLRPGDALTYTRRQCVRGKPMVLADKRSAPSPTRSRPEALGSPAGYVVRPGRRLLWPHPSHSWPAHGLFASSVGHYGREWFPNLSCLSVRACHPQDPGESDGCFRLLLPHQRWSSPTPSGLDIHSSTPLVLAWRCNEADSGSLALRPARWLALHQQGHLQPSFRRQGHPRPTSVMTTRAYSQFPRPDFHRRDKQPYGLQTDEHE